MTDWARRTEQLEEHGPDLQVALREVQIHGFERVIQHTRSTVMLMEPPDCPRAPTRVWCLFEGYQTLSRGGVLEVVLDEAALEPAAVRLTGHPGQGDVEAAFSGYRDVAGVRVAHRIDVRFDDGATLALEYRSVQRDTKLPPDAFHLTAPAGARVEGIDAAAAGKEPARAR